MGRPLKDWLLILRPRGKMRNQRRRARPNLWLAVTIVAFTMPAVASGYGTATQAKPSIAVVSHSPRVRDAYGHLPLSFEENRGQTDSRVKFLTGGGGYSGKPK